MPNAAKTPALKSSIPLKLVKLLSCTSLHHWLSITCQLDPNLKELSLRPGSILPEMSEKRNRNPGKLDE